MFLFSRHCFLIRKLKRKQSYVFTADERVAKQMDFSWDCLLGKFQPSQLVCTPLSRSSQGELFVLTTFSRFIGLCRANVISGQKNWQDLYLRYQSIQVSLSVFSFFIYFAKFFLTVNNKVVCFAGDYLH